MKEELIEAIDQSKECINATKARIDRYPIDPILGTGAAIYGTCDVINIVNKNWAHVGLDTTGTAILLALNHAKGRYRRTRQPQFIQRIEIIIVPSSEGEASLPGNKPIEWMLSGKETPLYTSLDGSLKINNPIELIQSLGSSAESTAQRVGIILRHAEKRDLNVGEIETLRRAQAALSLDPVLQSMLCDEGQAIVQQMNSTVTKYEQAHKKD